MHISKNDKNVQTTDTDAAVAVEGCFVNAVAVRFEDGEAAAAAMVEVEDCDANIDATAVPSGRGR